MPSRTRRRLPGREILGMAVQALRSAKGRSGLTVLGVVIGVATVTGMVSLIEGLNQSMSRQIQSFGTNTLYIRKFRPQIFLGGFPDSLLRRPAFTPADRRAILEGCPAVASVTALTFLGDGQPLRWRRRATRPTFVLGSDESYQETSGLDIDVGRFFTAEEVRRNSLVCVLGRDTYEGLLGGVDPIGREIRVGRVKFEVVGVAAPKGRFLGNNLDELVILPHTTLTKHYPENMSAFLKRGEVVLNAKARTPEEVELAVQQITELLRSRRGLRAHQDSNFAVLTDDALMDLYNSVTGAFYMAMILIASIALVVGGIGVMNVMLIAVTERTREIGLRKAVGARRGVILSQFLLEAVVLTGAGGAIGILVGVTIASLVGALTPLPSSVPLWSIIVGFSVSAAVGLFFGIYPAVRAAGLDPVEALRHE